MSRSIAELAFTYAALLVLGLPIFSLVMPRRFWSGATTAAVAPLLGVGSIALASTFLLLSGQPVLGALPISVFTSLAVAAVVVVSSRGSTADLFQPVGLSARGVRRHPWIAAMGITTIAVIAMPATGGGRISTPFRIGIDQVGYAESAQFLRDGGDLPTAAKDLRIQTGRSDPRSAERENLRSLRFNTYVDSEFLLKAYRWGSSAVIANVANLLGHPSVYSVQFPLVLILLLVLWLLVFSMVRDLWTLSVGGSSLVATLVLLNANGLNTVFEGQHAQVFSWPMLLLIIWLGGAGHRCGTTSSAQGRGEQWRYVVCVAVMFAALLVSYSDASIALVAVLGVMGAVEVARTRNLQWRWFVRLGAALTAGAVLVAPFSLHQLKNFSTNLGNVRAGGFPQPKWAYPSEIVGLQNIYGSFRGYAIVPRVPSDVVVTIILSAVVVGIALVSLWRRRDSSAFWVAGPIFVAAVFLKNYYLDPDQLDGEKYVNNYQYMKAYTIALPLIVVLVFAPMVASIRWHPSRLLAAAPSAIAVAVGTLAVLANGASYLSTFANEGDLIDQDLLELRDVDNRVQFEGHAVLTGATPIVTYMLTPIISMNWIDTAVKDGGIHIYDDNARLPVLLLDVFDAKGCLSGLDLGSAGEIVFRNDRIRVVRTDRTLEEVYDEETNTILWAKVSPKTGSACAPTSS